MMIKILRIVLFLSFYLSSSLIFAQGNVAEEKLVAKSAEAIATKTKIETTTKVKQLVSLEENVASRPPEVGKHVMANIDAGSMIVSLLMVLVLIIICAFVLKRFNLTQQNVSQLRVVSSLSLGAKERVIVVQMGEQQLLLGVTGQQITLLEKLAEPLVESTMITADLPKNILSFLSTQKR